MELVQSILQSIANNLGDDWGTVSGNKNDIQAAETELKKKIPNISLQICPEGILWTIDD